MMNKDDIRIAWEILREAIDAREHDTFTGNNEFELKRLMLSEIHRKAKWIRKHQDLGAYLKILR